MSVSSKSEHASHQIPSSATQTSSDVISQVEESSSFAKRHAPFPRHSPSSVSMQRSHISSIISLCMSPLLRVVFSFLFLCPFLTILCLCFPVFSSGLSVFFLRVVFSFLFLCPFLTILCLCFPAFSSGLSSFMSGSGKSEHASHQIPLSPAQISLDVKCSGSISQLKGCSGSSSISKHAPFPRH